MILKNLDSTQGRASSLRNKVEPLLTRGLRMAGAAAVAALMFSPVVLSGEDAPPPTKPEVKPPLAAPADAKRIPKADPKVAEKPKLDPKAEEEAKQLQAQINYRLELAEIHTKYGTHEVAQGVIEQAIKLGGEANPNLKAHFMLGANLQTQKKWQEAIKEYESILPKVQLANDFVIIAVLQGDCHSQLKEFDKAEKVLLSLTAGKNNPALQREGWKRLALYWKDHPELLAKTLEGAEAAVAKNASDAEALERLAEIYTDIKVDAAKADSAMSKLIALGTKDAGVQVRLAALYERQKQYEKAIKLYQGLSAKPGSADEWDISLRVANLMVLSGKKNEAVEMVEKTLVPKAQTALAAAGLGGFYDSAEMLEKAEEAFVKAASLSQTAEQVTACLLAAAEVSRKKKDYAKAEKYVRALLKNYKDNKAIKSQANAVLVKLYEAQGRLGELNLAD